MRWANTPVFQELSVEKTAEGLLVSDGKDEIRVIEQNGRLSSVICTNANGKVTLVRDEDARTIQVGEENTERTVIHFLGPNGPSARIRLGQTFHSGLNTWSSLPHDFELSPELGFEEFFYYLNSGANGNAIQLGRGIWANGDPVDEAWKVHDGDFAGIPMGYHPVVGEPGVRVSYIWAYLAKYPHWEKI